MKIHCFSRCSVLMFLALTVLLGVSTTARAEPPLNQLFNYVDEWLSTDNASATSLYKFVGTWTAEGGVPTETFVACAPLVMGACCDWYAGTCSMCLVASCNSIGGWPAGPGTVCSPDPCKGANGACCSFGGICWLTTAVACSEITCGAFAGGGTLCSTTSCPLGYIAACCFDDQCHLLTQCECTYLGGTFYAMQLSCVNLLCEQGGEYDPEGACCVLGSCNCCYCHKSLCVNSGGFFMGVGTPCLTKTCELFCGTP